MKRFSTLCLAILATAHVAIPMAVSAAPRVELDSSRQLTIRIYDYAGVSKKALSRAFHEIENIYRKAGVTVTMMRCRIALIDPVLDPRCGEIPGPAVLRIRIFTREMAEHFRLDKRVFGFAMIAPQPDFGVIANVFQERVETLAADTDASEGVILGHVLAHEAGHLLLGTGGHSGRGIMRIPWNGPELALAHRGRLVFTRAESAIIRREVATRSLVMRANTDSVVARANQKPETARRPGL